MSDRSLARALQRGGAGCVALCLTAALAGGLATLAGCGHSPHSYVPRVFPYRPGDGIAVLPSLNLTQDERAQRVIHEAQLVELLHAQTVRVIEPGLVREAMRTHRIWAADLLGRSQMQALSAALNVRFLLVGSIHEFGILEQERRAIPVVAIHLRLIDATSGEVVWAGEHVLNGDDRETVFGLGRVKSLDQLAQIVVRETLSSLVQLISQAESDTGTSGFGEGS